MIDRIKQLLDWQQLSPTQFADRIGVGRPVVSHILSERNKPSLEVVQRIIAAFPDLSLPWLLSGSGEMLAAGAPPATLTAPTTASTAPAGVQGSVGTTAAAAGQEPARPAAAAATPEPQSVPAPYQRAAPEGAGPARFQAGTTPLPASPEPGATRFVATPSPTKAQPGRPAVRQLAEAVSSTPPPAAPVPPIANVLVSESTAVPAPVLAAVTPPVAPQASPTGSEAAMLAQVLGEGLASPGKTIRRIVLFYTDGSFADFKPE